MIEYTAAVKHVTDAASHAAHEVAPALHHAADRVSEMASEGMSAMRQGSRLGATALALLTLLRRR